jgi:hypothetical protein
MKQFSTGDFIRIKDIQKYSDSLMNDENVIRQIAFIENGMASVNGCKQMIPICDLDPIPLGSKPDNIIYTSTSVPMASLIDPYGDKPRIGIEDPSYYKHDVIQQYIRENGFLYIHELQSFLKDHDLGELQFKM